MAEGRTVKRPIGEWLVAEGLITRQQLEEALQNRETIDGRRERIGESLERLGFVGPSDVSRVVAKQLGLQFVDSAIPDPQEGAASLIPEQLARRHNIVPLGSEGDGTLIVLTNDPTDIVAMDDVRLSAGARRLRAVVTPKRRIADALRRVYSTSGADSSLMSELHETTKANQINDTITEVVEDNAPVVRLAQQIIRDAINADASDIHVEPSRNETRIRYRIDGVLREMLVVPSTVHPQLVSRFKLTANMDIAERRRPQDGRAAFKSQNEEVDLRVSTLPLMYGEKVVMRLLRKSTERLDLADIGLSEHQYETVIEAIKRPQGLCLITGPTGSGKTSTLYSFLGHLSDSEHNLITIEDPVEYELDGVNQTQVNARIGFTFANALRTVLRQDPDIVMVGEIRDQETAEMALQASLTGHMVFSTLHTNDAPGAITRLADLGIAEYLIASSLTLTVAQRLGRRICADCTQPVRPSEKELRRLNLPRAMVEKANWQRGRGCSICGQTGYKGRIAFLEMLVVDKKIKEALMSRAGEQAIRTAALEGGMRSLRQDAIAKAMAGITTLEEAFRVTPADLDHS